MFRIPPVVVPALVLTASQVMAQPVETSLQVVIVVDTSESVRPFAPAIEKNVLGWLKSDDERKEPGFEYELALVVYGGKRGVRTVFDFTEDFKQPLEENLPKVLETFEGGSEPVGEALEHVLNDLAWKRVPRLRGRPAGIRGLIELYGNESFDQPGRDSKRPIGTQVVARPIFRGGVRDDQSIQLHTFYCGPKAEGKRLGWDAEPLHFHFYDFRNRRFGAR